MSELWMAPYTSPFAFSVGVRSSVAARSLRLLVAMAQSHIEITRLRSTPVGRGGASLGYAPAAMRSVESANTLRCAPSRTKMALVLAAAAPECLEERLGRFRQDVASLTVGDPNLGELGRQLRRSADHPHPCFGTVPACNDSLNVIGSARRRTAAAIRREEPRKKKHQNRGECP